MKRVLALVLVAALALTASTPGFARKTEAVMSDGTMPRRSRTPSVLFFDDMESGEGGWTHTDETATSVPKFHLDTYYAYEGTYSWWCGELNPAFSGGGGYANGWDMRLSVPPTRVTDASMPVLTYAFRYDSETGYDFTYVQAESAGVYVNLNRGYDGSSAGWNDLGEYGFLLAEYDDPANVRFRFVSDGAWSDEDGLYDSDGGAFHCDNVKIFDYYGGEVYFLDDCEDRGRCTPSVPDASGDWWHITSRACAAFSDPHCWWAGDSGDTSKIPGGLSNALLSPIVNLSGATNCSLRFMLHAEVPTVDNDYWTDEVSLDGGQTWHQTGAWWGDFAQCSGWGTHGINGVDLSQYLPGSAFQFRLTLHTTDNGCGPGEAGGAGIMLDDLWVEDWTGSAVEETTWGRVKAL